MSIFVNTAASCKLLLFAILVHDSYRVADEAEPADVGKRVIVGAGGSEHPGGPHRRVGSQKQLLKLSQRGVPLAANRPQELLKIQLRSAPLHLFLLACYEDDDDGSC